MQDPIDRLVEALVAQLQALREQKYTGQVDLRMNLNNGGVTGSALYLVKRLKHGVRGSSPQPKGD